jgi:RsiW-degrading membrane proteinase PrsW (M82 family)
MAIVTYSLLILFALAPSFIWLLVFLKKDNQPESNSMVLKIFFYGMLATVPTALLELGFFKTLSPLGLPHFIFTVLYAFVGISLIEEILKYLVVKKMALTHHEFDEPVDAMLYMIIAALGFAALENLLIFLPLENDFQISETAVLSILRFVSATFLHALCSGLIGYYLALSFVKCKDRFKLATKGIVIAVLLHGLYDFSIMEVEGSFKFLIPIGILLFLSVFVSIGFIRVKKLKSICHFSTN